MYFDKELNKHQDRLNKHRKDINSHHVEFQGLAERHDSLAVDRIIDSACIDSISDKLCRCGEVPSLVPEGRNIPTPALTYAGSEDSYHTPPVANTDGILYESPICPMHTERSLANDSNAENLPPVGRASGIPSDTVLVPIADGINMWEVPGVDWAEAERWSDEKAERVRRLAFGQTVHLDLRHQTCVRSVKRTDKHPHRMALGDHKQQQLCYLFGIGGSKSERRRLRALDRLVGGKEQGVGGYESSNESGSSGLDDADSWEFYRSKSNPVSPRVLGRAASANHMFI